MITTHLFGVIFDTSIFVEFVYRFKNRELIDILKDEDWFMLVCDKLKEEYIRQALRRAVSSKSVVDHFLKIIQNLGENKLIEEGQPDSPASVRIVNRKDQVHVDCAVKSESKAWVIVTNDRYDYQWDDNSWPEVPFFVDWETFANQNLRENLLADCRRLHDKFRHYPVS